MLDTPRRLPCSRLRRRPIQYAVLLLMLLTLAACSGPSATATTHATTTPAAPKVPLDAQLGSETLYVINASPVAIAPSGWALTAMNAATGNLRWKQSVDGVVDSAPAVLNGAVYVTTEKGSVYAFRANDGALSWKYDDGGLIYASGVVAP